MARVTYGLDALETMQALAACPAMVGVLAAPGPSPRVAAVLQLLEDIILKHSLLQRCSHEVPSPDLRLLAVVPSQLRRSFEF